VSRRQHDHPVVFQNGNGREQVSRTSLLSSTTSRVLTPAMPPSHARDSLSLP
jgi:hypothetical protein